MRAPRLDERADGRRRPGHRAARAGDHGPGAVERVDRPSSSSLTSAARGRPPPDPAGALEGGASARIRRASGAARRAAQPLHGERAVPEARARARARASSTRSATARVGEDVEVHASEGDVVGEARRRACVCEQARHGRHPRVLGQPGGEARRRPGSRRRDLLRAAPGVDEQARDGRRRTVLASREGAAGLVVVVREARARASVVTRAAVPRIAASRGPGRRRVRRGRGARPGSSEAQRGDQTPPGAAVRAAGRELKRERVKQRDVS